MVEFVSLLEQSQPLLDVCFLRRKDFECCQSGTCFSTRPVKREDPLIAKGCHLGLLQLQVAGRHRQSDVLRAPLGAQPHQRRLVQFESIVVFPLDEVTVGHAKVAHAIAVANAAVFRILFHFSLGVHCLRCLDEFPSGEEDLSLGEVVLSLCEALLDRLHLWVDREGLGQVRVRLCQHQILIIPPMAPTERRVDVLLSQGAQGLDPLVLGLLTVVLLDLRALHLVQDGGVLTHLARVVVDPGGVDPNTQGCILCLEDLQNFLGVVWHALRGNRNRLVRIVDGNAQHTRALPATS
mmetsp:Transcript_10713/g.27044  ORF Transcript_10713/g.27044 Transcript_10713/m.27044 type:complete len:294 (-) Transcript_10713:9-890(-)